MLSFALFVGKSCNHTGVFYKSLAGYVIFFFRLIKRAFDEWFDCFVHFCFLSLLYPADVTQSPFLGTRNLLLLFQPLFFRFCFCKAEVQKPRFCIWYSILNRKSPPNRRFYKKFFGKSNIKLTFTEYCNIIRLKGVKNTECCINFNDMIVQNSVIVNRILSLTGCKYGNLWKNQRIVRRTGWKNVRACFSDRSSQLCVHGA